MNSILQYAKTVTAKKLISVFINNFCYYIPIVDQSNVWARQLMAPSG